MKVILKNESSLIGGKVKVIKGKKFKLNPSEKKYKNNYTENRKEKRRVEFC